MKIALVATLIPFLASAIMADEAIWTAKGRTSTIEIEFAPNGAQRAVRLFVYASVPAVSSVPQHVGGTCPSWLWSSCTNFNNLLGPCPRGMTLSLRAEPVTGLAYQVQTRYCASSWGGAFAPNLANCIRISGELTGSGSFSGAGAPQTELLVFTVERNPGCQL